MEDWVKENRHSNSNSGEEMHIVGAHQATLYNSGILSRGHPRPRYHSSQLGRFRTYIKPRLYFGGRHLNYFLSGGIVH